MLDRSLPWLRLSAEFVVVVFGVLAALAADQWMEARDDRSTELEYVERLRANLAVDTLRFSQFAETSLAEKIRVLRELLQLREDPPVVEDADALMAGLTVSRYTAIPETRSEVFREMESTGRLGLLRDTSLREDLAAYYVGHGFMSARLDQSYGRYGEVLTGALPGTLWTRHASTPRPSIQEMWSMAFESSLRILSLRAS